MVEVEVESLQRQLALAALLNREIDMCGLQRGQIAEAAQVIIPCTLSSECCLSKNSYRQNLGIFLIWMGAE